MKRSICGAVAIAAIVGGTLMAGPATAATTTGDSAVRSAKQYVVVEDAHVAKDQRSVYGTVLWHTKSLSKGQNHFTVWAGIHDGTNNAITLGRINRGEAAVGKKGAMRFRVSWGRAAASKVAKVSRIRVSVTQRFNKAGTSQVMESALFDTVDVATSGKPGPLEPTGGTTCRIIR